MTDTGDSAGSDGGGSWRPTLDQRVTALEQRVGRIEIKIDHIEEALRRVEAALKELASDIREFRRQLSDLAVKLGVIDPKERNVPGFETNRLRASA